MSEVITTALDLLGMVLVVLAVALFVGQWSTPGAVAVAGVGLLGARVAIDHQMKGGRR